MDDQDAPDRAFEPISEVATRYRLPLAKLGSLTNDIRPELKALQITTCGRLLAEGFSEESRQRLAARAGVDPEALDRLVRRADLIGRCRGIGIFYGEMLEALGVVDTTSLACCSPDTLHAALCDHNERCRLIRRPPMLREVTGWIEQARRLPPLLR
jgi:predicted flap endonuclease-1-like 5' DNA nuclease